MTTAADRACAREDAGAPIVLEAMPDLAPAILRQRLVVEGVPRAPIGGDEVCAYLARLSRVCGMVTIAEPVTHRSERYGWAGWIHWETSGAHFYAWEQPQLFFSVDVYTCKAFVVADVVEFTRSFFDAAPIVAKEF
jgi:S-adenosylmethionine decarboxylase